MEINKIEIESDLKGIEISLVELFNVDASVASAETGAHVGVDQAALDPIPILSIADSFLQPVRVITDAVLLIPSIGQNLSGAAVGDGEGEDGEAEPEEYEEEHGAKVEPEEARDAAASADETGDGDEHEEDSENDDWFVEETLALGGCIFAEPDSGGEDGDREEEGEEVEDSDKVIATLNHCFCFCLVFTAEL